MGTDRNNHNVAPVMLEWQLIYYSIMQFNKQTTTSTDLLVLDTYPITSPLCPHYIKPNIPIYRWYSWRISRSCSTWETRKSVCNPMNYEYIQYIYIYMYVLFNISIYIYKHAINPKSKFTKPTDDRASTKNHETFTIFAWIIIPIFFGRVV